MASRQRISVQSGFILVEALVSILVVSVGLLGVAKLNTVLINGSGSAKARAEASLLAQRVVELARDYDGNVGDGCGNLTGVNTTVDGRNATYSILSSYTDIKAGTTLMSKTLNVCVAWDGASTDCSNINKSIKTSARISCQGTGTSAMIGEGGASSLLSRRIKTPTGRAVVGSGESVTSNDTLLKTDGTSGLKTYKQNGTGNLLLVDKNNKVLLVSRALDCEIAAGQTAPDFSTIEGTVFVQDDGNKTTEANDMYVLSSDASYCWRNVDTSGNGSYGTAISASGKTYHPLAYKCYVGAEWWGNIGVTSIATNVAPSLRVCVGNHTTTTSSNLFSKHPKIATTRGYRAYRVKSAENSTWESKGIGESDEKITCTGAIWQQYRYIAQQFINHHFVYSSIGSSAKDTDCLSPLTDLSTSNQFYLNNNVPTLDPATLTSTTTSRSSTAQNNPGKMYCMSADDGVSCPALTVTESTPTTTLKGTITPEGGATFVGITSTAVGSGSGTTCSSVTWATNSDGTYSYSCQINWSGFIGTDWSGVLPFSTSGTNTLCAEGASHTVMPTTASIAYTILDRLAATNPNSVKFTNIPRAVTEITLNIAAKPTACATLGQPVVTEGTGNNKSNWIWDAITNANQYKVYSCSITGTSACTLPSTPTTTSATTGSVNSFSNTSVNTSETRCIKVVASHSTNAFADGPASAAKCMTHTVEANGNSTRSKYPVFNP